MKKQIGNRLITAASFVRPGSRVADIGTDHAYLPIYLAENKIAGRIIATDIKKGPLLNAQINIERIGVEDIIELRLSDGLDCIFPDEFDDLIICGMGGILITEILTKAPWIRSEKYRLIIQPQSHSEEVRKYLADNLFHIIEEKSCEDHGRYYHFIIAQYTGLREEHPLLYYYFGNLIYDKSVESRIICERHLKYIKTLCDADKDYKSGEKYREYKTIIDEAERILNDN